MHSQTTISGKETYRDQWRLNKTFKTWFELMYYETCYELKQVRDVVHTNRKMHQSLYKKNHLSILSNT